MVKDLRSVNWWSCSDRVTDLRPDDSEENPFYYMFKVKCTSCHEVHPNRVGINRFVSHEISWTCHVNAILTVDQESNKLSGSKGDANFVWKCKHCRVGGCSYPGTDLIYRSVIAHANSVFSANLPHQLSQDLRRILHSHHRSRKIYLRWSAVDVNL